MHYIGIDFETYSGTDLRKHGLDRYVNDPDFTPLIVSLKTPGSPATNFDFVVGGLGERQRFADIMFGLVRDPNTMFVAHNAGFERAVLYKMGFTKSWLRSFIVDSAVVARAEGGGSHLETAAPQLVGISKLDTGSKLIQKFSIPNEWNNYSPPTAALVQGTQDWAEFMRYCEVDAEAGCMIVNYYADKRTQSTKIEPHYEQLTAQMNEVGWRVDMDLVYEMERRYKDNVQREQDSFRSIFDPKGELNLNSSMQLKNWCADRGILAKSFDAEHVQDMFDKLQKKLGSMQPDDPKFDKYIEVRELLRTKLIMGGSSLTKLQKIIDTVGPDGRLRHQYMHIGAGQTYRTSGRGVQLQNLKRLGAMEFEMEDVLNDSELYLSNDDLAENLRQVFTATDPNGRLVVGDFSSVESRGLSWLAGADWKISAFKAGMDLYKVQAAQIYGVGYDDVTKEQRQVGKVGELSCGYGAGGDAVQAFAKGFGVALSTEESQTLVNDWRQTNPEIVDLWHRIDEALMEVMKLNHKSVDLQLAHQLQLSFDHVETPQSLLNQHAGAKSIRMRLAADNGRIVLDRVFHGCYLRGKSICYYKPADRKTGPLWSSEYRDPKTGQRRFYSIYGGKVTGILTQSFCRELFFMSLQRLFAVLNPYSNATVIGQFHDEIVVDWEPAQPRTEPVRYIPHAELCDKMAECMSWVEIAFQGFPLQADIKSAYRYIK